MQCKKCNQDFTLNKRDITFLNHFKVKHNNLCFFCSQKQRLCFRNERCFYQRKCDFSNRKIISVYHKDSPYTIYQNDIWHSDKWDPLKYGQVYDKNKSFFEQFQELKLKVPRLAMLNIKAENSDYCNYTYGNKNCYLMIGADFNENCMFGTLSCYNKDSLDIDYSDKCELCYEITDSISCYNCQFVYYSKNCHDCFYLYNCSGCSNCILCCDLVNKSYCINNKQYSKQDFESEKQKIINNNIQERGILWNKFITFKKKQIHKYAHIYNSEDCTGENIYRSKNCTNSFDVSDSENLHNIILAQKSKDSYNSCLLGVGSDNCYQHISSVNAYNCQFTNFIIDSSDIFYSDFILNSKNCFGCTNLNHQDYCILNKKYSKSDYEKLKLKIISEMKRTGEWGKYFPAENSCFGYNETTANIYFPLEKEEAIEQGFNWLAASKIKSQNKNNPNIIECDKCSKEFKIVEQELNFYNKQNLPLPKKCSDCRHQQRILFKNGKTLYPRQCDQCKKSLLSPYSIDCNIKIFCEKCYQKEIY